VGGSREIAERFIASLEARDWEAWTALLHPDVVYEIPQSRERIRGRDRYLRFNQEFRATGICGPRSSSPTSSTGWCGSSGASTGRTDDAMAFFEFADGLITRVTDFWPEPYEPPSGREHLTERW
jgi:ketosteroid isomerase-like protein